MNITSGRTLSHSVSLVGRARARLIHLTAAGAPSAVSMADSPSARPSHRSRLPMPPLAAMRW